MKNIKKLLSIVMVLAMVLSLGVSALAATITLPAELSGHKMVAYKIFEGTQNEAQAGTFKLGVTDWADGVDSEALLKALVEKYSDKGFSEDMTAARAAEAIGNMHLSGDAAVEFSRVVKGCITTQGTEITSGTTELGSGYWIIVDETTFTEGEEPEGWAYSAYLLQVIGNEGSLELSDKVDIPHVDKKVGDQNDSDVKKLDPVTGEVAAYDIGDLVPFTLTATMPGRLELLGYSSYELVFHDTLSAGLTYDETYSNLEVKIKHVATDSEETVTTDYTVTHDSAGNLTITIADAMAAPFNAKVNDVITVTYKAKLNENAVIGGDGNQNTVYLEYSNNPNDTGTGDTKEEKVTVFTFQLDVDKVDGSEDKKPLPGAGFTLYKWNAVAGAGGEDVGEWKQVGSELKGEGMTTFTFKGLDAGKYKIVETTVPAGYNKADDIEFTVVAELDEDNQTVTSLKVLDAEGKDISDASEGKVPTFNCNREKGLVDTDVINNSGMELPETGGIGTTIFYVVGAVLVVGAVILLVTRKRVSGAEK